MTNSVVNYSLGSPVNVTQLIVRSIQREARDFFAYVFTAHLTLVNVPINWQFATREIVH